MSVNTKVNGQLVKSAGLYSVTAPIGMADIYSTEEKEVGLWKNNKPLYQKTIVIGNGDVNVNQGSAPNYYVVVDSGISNIEEAFGLVDKSFMILSSDSSPRFFSWIDYQGKGSSQFVLNSTNSRTNVTVVLTIQYTKTTDTPWSGKFVPQGYGYVSSGDIYSFEERQIGVFADGKPLYQKTIDFGELPNNTTKQVAHNVSNIETVVEVKGVSYVNNLIFGENIPPVTAGKTFRTSVRETTVDVVTTDNWTGYNARITFRYTKTTDVAGSGEYVPSGNKAVHYSTEEEVIGTWVDGSTLYQKTIEVSSTEVANHTKTDSDITNADVLLIEDGYYMINNGLKLALNQFESASAYTRTGFRDDNSLYFYVNGYTSCQGAVVTIRYTKTS